MEWAREGTVTAMRSRPAPVRNPHDGPALLLRLAVGPMLMAHGYNKVFGKGGLEGTTRWFGSLGLHPPEVHARMAAATELGAGALITMGAASPLPAAAAIGLMATAARTDHRGKGFFVFKGGWEYTGVVARGGRDHCGTRPRALLRRRLARPAAHRHPLGSPGRRHRGVVVDRPDRRQLPPR